MPNEPVMEFEIKRDGLKTELDFVKSVVDKKKTIAALGYVHIETSDKPSATGRVRLTCSDMKNTVRVEVEARVLRPGSACILGEKFFETVESLPAGSEVHLATGEDHRTDIKCERSHFRIAGMATDSYPELASVTPHSPGFVIDSERLLRMVDRTSYAASRQDGENRYQLKGALLTSTRSFDRMVTTDSHRLAVVKANGMQRANHQEINVLVPEKALAVLPKLLRSHKGDVRVAADESYVRFEVGSRVLTSSLLTGQFPNWEMVIPKNLDRSAAILAGALTQALRRVAPMAQDKDKGVVLSFTEGALALSARLLEGGEASDVITSPEIEYTPPPAAGDDADAQRPCELKLNLEYLLDAISPLGATEVIKFEFRDSGSPVKIKPIGEERTSTSAVIMPLRL